MVTSATSDTTPGTGCTPMANDCASAAIRIGDHISNDRSHEAYASRRFSTGGDHLESRHPDQATAKREADHQTGYGEGPQSADQKGRDHPHRPGRPLAQRLLDERRRGPFRRRQTSRIYGGMRSQHPPTHGPVVADELQIAIAQTKAYREIQPCTIAARQKHFERIADLVGESRLSTIGHGQCAQARGGGTSVVQPRRRRVAQPQDQLRQRDPTPRPAAGTRGSAATEVATSWQAAGSRAARAR